MVSWQDAAYKYTDVVVQDIWLDIMLLGQDEMQSAPAAGNSMPPPAARPKTEDDDIFGDAGTDYVCELPKVSLSTPCLCVQDNRHMR